MERSEIFEKIQEILVDALAVDDDEVSSDRAAVLLWVVAQLLSAQALQRVLRARTLEPAGLRNHRPRRRVQTSENAVAWARQPHLGGARALECAVARACPQYWMGQASESAAQACLRAWQILSLRLALVLQLCRDEQQAPGSCPPPGDRAATEA